MTLYILGLIAVYILTRIYYTVKNNQQGIYIKLKR